MSHQQNYVYNYEQKKTIPEPFDPQKVIEQWDVGHYGGYKKPSAGKITMHKHLNGALGGAYLECQVDGVPFFSVLSDIDQWGTWHTLKLGTEDNDNAEYTYAYMWGRPSFIRALAEALTKLADMTEPPATKEDQS